jgi:hypothetical protein
MGMLNLRYLSLLVLYMFFVYPLKSEESNGAETRNKSFNLNKFDLIIEVVLNHSKKQMKFDLQKDTFSETYQNEYIFRGVPFKEKVHKLNISRSEKEIIKRDIIRSKIVLLPEKLSYRTEWMDDEIFPVKYTVYGTKYIFSINDNINIMNKWKCETEALTISNPDEDTNKLWTLYQIVELILEKRNLSFVTEEWIIDDLKERMMRLNEGKPLEFPDDKLPAPFDSLLNNTDKLKKFMESWDRGEK